MEDLYVEAVMADEKGRKTRLKTSITSSFSLRENPNYKLHQQLCLPQELMRKEVEQQEVKQEPNQPEEKDEEECYYYLHCWYCQCFEVVVIDDSIFLYLEHVQKKHGCGSKDHQNICHTTSKCVLEIQ